jgi:hypothetical protein
MKNNKFFIACFALAATGFLVAGVGLVLAADGSGAMSVNPTTAVSGSSGNTHTFTFSATETMDSGGFSVNVPSGWSTPQGTAGVAGYTTANSTAGVVADVLNNLDTVANWNIIPDMALTGDTGDKQEGTASLANSISESASANQQWYFDYGGASNWGATNGNTTSRIGFWLKSSVSAASGDFYWQDDNSAGLASPLDTLAIPALAANTWTYASVTLGGNRTSQMSYGFRYTSDIGALDFKADAISKIFDAADSTAGWSGDGGITRSVLTSSGNFKEGTGAIRCAYSNNAGIGSSGDCFNSEGAVFILGPDTTVSFWLRSSVALNAGDFAFTDDNSSNIASPLDVISLPAIPANTWTYLTLTAPNSGSARSYGVRQLVDRGALNLDIDAIGKVIDTMDATTGWNVPVPTQTLSADAAVKQEGANSLKNTFTASAGAGSRWYEILGSAQNWSGYTAVGLWIRSNVATNAGDLKFEYSSATDLSNPIASLNIGALAADTWSYQKLTLSGTRTTVNSYGLNYATDLGAAAINLDDVLIGPGSPTFAGSDINVRLLDLANGQTARVVYGSGGGASGATVPASCSTSTFAVLSKVSDAGALTAIASSPAVSTIGPVSEFILSDHGDITAGDRASYTIIRQDSCGNLVTAGSTTVYLYSTSAGANKRFYDSAAGGNIIASVAIADGSSGATVWYYDETPGAYTITASDNSGAPDGAAGITDATDLITVSAGPVAQFSLNNPGNMTAGTRLGYTVTRQDQFGNLISAGATTVYLYTSGVNGNQKFYDAATAGNQVNSIVIADGSSGADFWYYDELAGNATVTASDNPSAPDGVTGITDAADVATVSPAATQRFLLNDPGNMTASTTIGYIVSRQDQFGNSVTAGNTTVYLFSNSSGSRAFYDAASGGNIISSKIIGDGNSSANFWYYDEAVGAWTVTATDNASAPDGATGLADASDTVTVDPAPIVATRFVILDPTDGSVDAPITVTVQAQDGSGSIDTTYQNDVTLLAGGSASGGGLVNIINGVGTLNLADTVAETLNLTLSDTQTTGLNISSTQNVVFAPGATAQFTLNNPGDIGAGNRAAYTVTRKDQYGNLVTAGNNAVYLYANSTGASNKFYDEATAGNVITFINIAPGQATADVWYYDDKAGSWSVVVSDNALTPDGDTGINDASDPLTVAPAATAQFILNNPGDMTANTRLGYIVSREDQFGNAVTSGATTVYLYGNSGGSAVFYNAAVNGNTITSVTIGNNNSSADFWYLETAVGTWTVTASDNASAPDGSTGVVDATDSVTVSAAPIVATRLVILPPTNTQVGDNATITIQAQDDAGNIQTTYQQDVTLVTDGSATGGGLVNIVNGVGAKVITDAVAETVNLSLSDTENTGLNIDSVQSIIFSVSVSAPVITGGGGYVAVPEIIPPAGNFIVSGRVYPNAVVLVTEAGDGEQVVRRSATASPVGVFNLEVESDTPAAHIYGVTVKDKNGRLSQTKIFNADFTKLDEITKTIFMPPTIDVARAVMTKGDFVKVVGFANPNARIRIQVDNNISYETRADAQGAYAILINTARLDLGSHTLQARQLNTATGKYSDPSLSRNFLVSSLAVPRADLNDDGQIDAKDLSMFNSLYKKQDKLVDLNDDGKINATDLSIFLRAVK